MAVGIQHPTERMADISDQLEVISIRRLGRGRVRFQSGLKGVPEMVRVPSFGIIDIDYFEMKLPTGFFEHHFKLGADVHRCGFDFAPPFAKNRRQTKFVAPSKIC